MRTGARTASGFVPRAPTARESPRARWTVTLAAIPVGNNPQGVAIAVDGTFAYVANSGSGTVSRIRTSDDAITATVTVGSEPVDVAMAANGTFAYVTNEGSGTVSRISTSDNAVVATIPTCVSPRGVAISPDSTFAYLACHGTAPSCDFVRPTTPSPQRSPSPPVSPAPSRSHPTAPLR